MQYSEPFKGFIRNYWSYYRELEDDFLSVKRYVDFSFGNFGTYSIEILKLYQAVCSEIDVIGKAMASTANAAFKPEDKKNSIYKWWYEIQNNYTVKELDSIIPLSKYRCTFMDDDSITPWENFSICQKLKTNKQLYYAPDDGKHVPSWWVDYNTVKHNRTSLNSDNPNETNYKKANLKNLIYAFAALYTLEKAYMQSIGTVSDLEAYANHSQLFECVQYTTTEETDAMLNEVFGFA